MAFVVVFAIVLAYSAVVFCVQAATDRVWTHLPTPDARGSRVLEVYLFGLCVLRWERRARVRTRVGEPMLMPSLPPMAQVSHPQPSVMHSINEVRAIHGLPPLPEPANDPTIFVP